MKSKITGLVLLAVLITFSTFATNIEDNVDRKVSSAFTQKFSDAREVTWNITDKYVKARFILNEQVMFAYFTQTGELIGVSRNILASRLPLNLQAQLKKSFPDGWITELFEYATDQETVYYATIETSNEKKMISSIGTISWIVYKKVKKIEP